MNRVAVVTATDRTSRSRLFPGVTMTFSFELPRPSLPAFIVIFVCMLGFASTTFADEGFTEDATAAVERAKAEDKDLLLLFTGSDWCPPCKRLEAEVFSKQEFLDGAADKYVLVKLDFPKSTPQDPQLVQQNAEWAQKYGIASYPTVIMVDQDLRPFAFSGYEAGGPENYLNVIGEAHQQRILRDQKLAAAELAEGDEKAKLLDEAIADLGEEVVNVYYTDIVEQIVALDSDNELGLRYRCNKR